MNITIVTTKHACAKVNPGNLWQLVIRAINRHGSVMGYRAND